MTNLIRRNTVVALLGTPNLTEGSLNDPVEQHAGAVLYNEKWTYLNLPNDPAGAAMRMIYWHRYDFAGTLIRSAPDEEWRPDSRLAEVLSATDARLSDFDPDRNPPMTPSAPYRPVSDFIGQADLGGHIEPDNRARR